MIPSFSTMEELRKYIIDTPKFRSTAAYVERTDSNYYITKHGVITKEK